MNDGYSNGGSLGLGLGALRRLSTAMDFYSAPAKGTAIYSRVEADPPAAHPRSEEPTWCAIRVAAPGESECGDACHVARLGTRISGVVADGLGHNPLAAKAANEAVRIFEQAPFHAPQTYIPVAHEALRATRGAVFACALVDLGSQVMVYAGVGNLAASLVAGKTQSETSLPSDNGTLGLQIGKVRQYQYTALEGDLLVMHSDALTSRWKLADYPGLSRRAPALIAGGLVSRFQARPGRRHGSCREVEMTSNLGSDERQLITQEVLQLRQERDPLNAELAGRDCEIEALRVELDETNRGVVALYAELDDKAAALPEVLDLTSRFLSYLSHVFRTPLGAIRSMARLLLDRIDGALT